MIEVVIFNLNLNNQLMSGIDKQEQTFNKKQDIALLGQNVEEFSIQSSNLIKQNQNKQEDVQIQTNDPQSNNPPEKVDRCCKMTKKTKIITLVSASTAILMIIALSIGLSFAFRVKVQVKDTRQVKFQDGSYMRLTQMSISDRNILQPDLKFDLIKSQVVSVKKGDKRQLQSQNVDGGFVSTVNFDKQGIVLQVFPNSTAKVMVNMDKMIDYLVATDPQIKRMLQQIDNNQSKANSNQTYEQLKKQLSQSLSQQLNQGKSVPLTDKMYVSFEYDKEKNAFIEKPQNKDTIKLRLLIGQKRILFLGKLLKGVGKVVKKIVKPVVNLIRNNGQYIGAAIGAVAGFAVGGPALAYTWGKLGYSIGSIAKQAVSSCIPRNSLRIRCDYSSIHSAAMKFGTMFTLGEVTGIGPWFKTYNPFAK